MSKEFKPYKGDIIIVKDNSKVSTAEDRKLIEKDVPYFIEKLGASSGVFYITILGKDIMFFSSDHEYLEHIQVAERGNYNIGDFVTILDDEKIEGALKMGFRDGLSFEITNVINGTGVVIVDTNQSQLLIREDELQFIVSVTNQNKLHAKKILEKSEENNIQYLIDKALDERDFIKLEELRKLNINEKVN